MVRALPFHQCGPSLNPGHGVISGMSSPCFERFVSRFSRFPRAPAPKLTFPNSNLIWIQWTNSHSVDVLYIQSNLIYLFIYLFIYLLSVYSLILGSLVTFFLPHFDVSSITEQTNSKIELLTPIVTDPMPLFLASQRKLTLLGSSHLTLKHYSHPKHRLQRNIERKQIQLSKNVKKKSLLSYAELNLQLFGKPLEMAAILKSPCLKPLTMVSGNKNWSAVVKTPKVFFSTSIVLDSQISSQVTTIESTPP